MILKTLGKTTLAKLKIGDIFAYNACWCIFEKISDNKVRLLADDYRGSRPVGNILIVHKRDIGGILTFYHFEPYQNSETSDKLNVVDNYIYKLPVAIQKLWKTGK